MRKTSILAVVLTAFACLPSCSSIPTSFDGIVKAAGELGGDLSGFLGNLNLNDTSTLNESTLGGLGGMLGTAKSLLGGLDNLPEDAKSSAMSTSGFDSFKGALGSIADFDLDGLLGASGEGKKSMLEGLMGNVTDLEGATSTLMGAIGM